MSEENKARSRRFIEEVWNQGNMAVVDEIVAPDFVNHTALDPNEAPGPEPTKAFVTAMRTAFPDLQVKVDDMVAEGDMTVSRWTATGTHRGDFMGIPATNKVGTTSGMTMSRHKGGKIVEAWAQQDMMGLMQQLGVVPMPGEDG